MDNIKCCVCWEPVSSSINYLTLLCGHTICFTCRNNILRAGDHFSDLVDCPLCKRVYHRADWESGQPSILIRELLERCESLAAQIPTAELQRQQQPTIVTVVQRPLSRRGRRLKRTLPTVARTCCCAIPVLQEPSAYGDPVKMSFVPITNRRMWMSYSLAPILSYYRRAAGRAESGTPDVGVASLGIARGLSKGAPLSVPRVKLLNCRQVNRLMTSFPQFDFEHSENANLLQNEHYLNISCPDCFDGRHLYAIVSASDNVVVG